MALTQEQVLALQSAYRDLLDYDSEDPSAPITPMSYQTPDGDRLIHIAALRGDLETVETLLRAGENINAMGDMGNTPAHYAAMGKSLKLFDFLMESGADPSLENEFGTKAGAAWGA